MARKKVSNNFMMAILYVVVGVLLCIFKASVLSWVMTAAGVLFVVAGVLDIFKHKNTTNGIINIVIGIAILVAGWLLLEIALIVFGVLIVINGVKEFLAVKSKKLVAYVSPVVTILVGALLVVAKWVVADWFFIIVGVVFVVNGVLALLGKK